MKFKKLLILAFVFTSINSFACFWDYDTIEMENQQFPSAIELISGKFLRHSSDFYLWRVERRIRELKSYPDSLALYDDLAVAYSKLGDQKRAIQIMLRKDSLSPGLYETYANLGTFYLHNGNFTEGEKYIQKAIEINPDAHFGREKYQLFLVKYLQTKMKNGKIKLPLSVYKTECKECPPPPPNEMNNFYSYLLAIHQPKDVTKSRIELQNEVLDLAIQGVLGMMKFGNHDSPILLEALGDLLMANGWQKGARQLAARAYLKASYEVSEESVKEEYRRKAVLILVTQHAGRSGKNLNVNDVEKLLQQELLQGQNFFNEITQNERMWISQGLNPEQEFAKTYYQEPNIEFEKVIGTGRDFRNEDKYLEPKGIKTYLDSLHLKPEQTDSLFIANKNTVDSLFYRWFNNIPDKEEDKMNTEVMETSILQYLIPIAVILLVVLLFVYFKRNDRNPE